MTLSLFYMSPESAPTPEQLAQIIGLYQEARWWSAAEDNADLVRRIIAGSHCFLLATDDRDLIGMGRAISDRASDAYIQDVTVRKDYRGQGIGSKIVAELVGRLNADGLHWIGLIAEKGSHGFYTPLGFAPMPEALPMLYQNR
jgi:ribosomal protein S18 acetylase RimI-like enzyme